MNPRRLLLCAAALTLSGCALMPWNDPLNVDVVGVEPIAGESMELRMAIKLRVQNPNETPIGFDGAAVWLDVRGKRLGSGVIDQAGTVPRYGEVVLTIPVSVPPTALIRQALGVVSGPDTRTDFVVRGKLSGTGYGSVRFESRGELSLPAVLSGPAR
ncbi:MAG: LEA type 2 family protein [Burkholderiaceae bacterium]